MELSHWFYGLADCHGVESFVHDVDDMSKEIFMTLEDDKVVCSQQFAMCLRAQANAQRHAVVYRAAIPQAKIADIEALIKDGKYVEALNEIKEHATEIMLGTYGTTKAAAEKRERQVQYFKHKG
jgi:hypothetical protein